MLIALGLIFWPTSWNPARLGAVCIIGATLVSEIVARSIISGTGESGNENRNTSQLG